MHSLSDKKLSFSPAVEIVVLPDGTQLLKQTERGAYLALAAERREIMERFDGEKTVEGVLRELLVEGKNPGIRSFYDLVLIAMERGFLLDHATASIKESVEKPVPPVTAMGRLGIVVSLALIVLGARVLFRDRIELGFELSQWLLILVLTSVGLSLANAMAASALRRFGRQAYDARIRWDRLLPYFHLDNRDAFMGGRACEIAVALRALAAPFLLAIVCDAFDADAGILAGCIVALTLISPFGETPGHTLLHAAFRKEYELPKCAQRFLNAKLFAQMFNWKTKLKEENYFLTYSTCAILWLTGVFYFTNRLIHNQVDALYIAALADLPQDNETMTWLALGLLSVILASIIVYFVWLIGRGVFRMAAPILFPAEGRLTRNAASLGDEADATVKFLKGTLLFSQLSDDLTRQIHASMKPIDVAPDQTIIRERDPGDCMFVIQSGSVEICKEDESGLMSIVATLSAGDVFGEMALLNKTPRNSTVRSRESTRLLSLSRKDFEELLLKPLGANQIKEIVHISASLKRNKLFADWHPNALVSLAHKFTLETRIAGQPIIEKDQVNEFFYIVYQGRFKVVREGEEFASLGPGDFCGEISLLSDAPANADVVATTYGACLKLGKKDFLEFVSHDFLTGLAVENAASARRTERSAA